jgi:hypothetical protein
MSRSILAVAAVAFPLAACAGIADDISPKLQADNQAVASDTATLDNELKQVWADQTTNPSALPADAIKFSTDQATLRGAFATLAADLKAAGQAAPVTPPALSAVAPAN